MKKVLLLTILALLVACGPSLEDIYPSHDVFVRIKFTQPMHWEEVSDKMMGLAGNMNRWHGINERGLKLIGSKNKVTEIYWQFRPREEAGYLRKSLEEFGNSDYIKGKEWIAGYKVCSKQADLTPKERRKAGFE